jgi:magnesium-transporting ATPase (P-type)
LRIAEALQARGHVVAMTGDGVNDGPALSRADIGVALGRSGTDVAREAADLVLLDDRLGTIVDAIEHGRTTFLNIRKFLTYHLTDNVAELTPFAVWALSGGRFPLALAVLQVLALDIGTDLLPAIALGNEPSNRRRVLAGPMPTDRLVDRRLLVRALGVLGPTEALGSMVAFTVVLLAGGWVWLSDPDPALLAMASGTAFAAVVLGQLANAFACRSATRWAGAVPLLSNRLLLWAVVVELVLLAVFLGVPAVAEVLGGTWPSPLGWLMAALVAPLIIGVDALHKLVAARRRVVRP